MSVAVKVVWVQRAPDGRSLFAVHPPSVAAPAALPEQGADKPFLVTNDPEALHELLAESAGNEDAATVVLDVAELFRFAFPASPAETVPQMVAAVADVPPDAAALWQVWEAMSRRFAGMPLWVLETIELLLREVGEAALARFFGQCGSDVRATGRGCGAWNESFVAANLRQFQRVVPPHADCSPLDVEVVAGLLSPGGPLSRLMPGYEPRPGQIEMLRSVVHAFNDGKHLLASAGKKTIEEFKAGAKAADRIVRDHPYASIALGFGAGLLAGWLLGGRSDD